MARFVRYTLFLAFFTRLDFCSSLGSQVSSDSDDLNVKSEIILPNECLKQLIKFAEHTSEFTKCVISNAQPIRVCENCTTNYFQVVDSYQDILKINTSNKEENCRDILTNIDRLQVVHASFNYVDTMWDNASCSLCLNSNGTDLNERTKMIKHLENSLQKCNETIKNNSISCVECKQIYLNLTNYYDRYKTKDGFCMDIVDLVNKTQISWSEMCHEFNSNIQWKLLVISFIILLLPILFYLTNWHSYRGGYVLLPENRYHNETLTNNITSTSGYVAIS